MTSMTSTVAEKNVASFEVEEKERHPSACPCSKYSLGEFR